MKTGTFYDPWRGNGIFASFRPSFGPQHVTLCLRWRWHLYFIKPASKTHYRRLYLGPLEIEWSVQP
jgi:hypothetical protein